jgi:ATPase subunit of ABC transporter with duplicated ATPase domains
LGAETAYFFTWAPESQEPDGVMVGVMSIRALTLSLVLDVENLRIDLGHRVLLEGASFRLQEGEKVALVGPNGAGKTTLLKTLAGERHPSGGVVNRPEYFVWLQQDVSAKTEEANRMSYDHLLSASPLTDMAEQLKEWQARIEKAGIDMGAGIEGADDALDKAVKKFSNLEERYRTLGGYQVESEAERIAAGVGLDDEALLRAVGTLSGGQRRRLELARLLLAGGDLMILDEPTNHLDVEAKRWVMEFLKKSKSTILVVSHDIDLMDSAIDRVLALEAARIEQYKGTYTQFLKQREERESLRARESANFNKEIERLEKSMDKFRGANETHVQKRKNLLMRMDHMKKKRGPEVMQVKRRVMRVRFPEPVRAGDRTLTVTGLAKAFGTEVIFSDVTFDVARGDVFLVLGLNGAGKTTLLRALAGVHTPDAGTVKMGANVKMGFYAQEHEDITPTRSVISLLREVDPTVQDPTLRGILAHFGMVGDVADQEAGTLSGGEKTKLSLARLMIGKSNLLLLDEPTNNLDPPSREAVLAALQNYKGTIIIVSHDTEFVAQLAPTGVLMMPEGQLMHYDEKMLDLIELV